MFAFPFYQLGVGPQCRISNVVTSLLVVTSTSCPNLSLSEEKGATVLLAILAFNRNHMLSFQNIVPSLNKHKAIKRKYHIYIISIHRVPLTWGSWTAASPTVCWLGVVCLTDVEVLPTPQSEASLLSGQIYKQVQHEVPPPRDDQPPLLLCCACEESNGCRSLCTEPGMPGIPPDFIWAILRCYQRDTCKPFELCWLHNRWTGFWSSSVTWTLQWVYDMSNLRLLLRARPSCASFHPSRCS